MSDNLPSRKSEKPEKGIKSEELDIDTLDPFAEISRRFEDLSPDKFTEISRGT